MRLKMLCVDIIILIFNINLYIYIYIICRDLNDIIVATMLSKFIYFLPLYYDNLG